MGIIIAIFLAAIISIVVFTAGNMVLFGTIPWSVFIAYIVALRFLLTSINGLNRIAKNGSNIYHYVMVINALKAGTGENVFVIDQSGFSKEDYELQLEDSYSDDDDF